MRKRRREREELEAGVMAAPVEQRRITPMDIQQKEFRLALRGYNEREVDEFLDALTEELARLHSENVRFQAELENREQEARAAQAEAEATLRRAREEAMRMLEEAEMQARSVSEVTEGSPALAEGAASVGSFLKKNSMVQAIRPFLGREREFLQSMARLIQEHADSVREEVKQIREEPSDSVDEGGARDIETDRTALPGQTAPDITGTAARPPTAPEPGIPRRPRKRVPESQGNAPGAVASREPTPERGGGREVEDGRRRKGRQAPAGPSAGSSGRSGDPLRGDASSESGPADLFQPRRRVARPPVSRLEEEGPPGRSSEEGISRKDLPATQPFEPFRFDERSMAGDQPLERGEGDEDERSLRELFWGEE
jgi:cell division initiation protein